MYTVNYFSVFLGELLDCAIICQNKTLQLNFKSICDKCCNLSILQQILSKKRVNNSRKVPIKTQVFGWDFT